MGPVAGLGSVRCVSCPYDALVANEANPQEPRQRFGHDCACVPDISNLNAGHGFGPVGACITRDFCFDVARGAVFRIVRLPIPVQPGPVTPFGVKFDSL